MSAATLILIVMLGIASPVGARAQLNPADELETLHVMTERKAYYERDDWGRYTDSLIPNDGCDTRCELINENRRADGTLYSTYDGFVSSNAGEFQVDHVVSVNEAHRSGGREWSAERKNAFYNDRSSGELRLVSSASNQAKSNLGPSTSQIRYWMPDYGTQVQCQFIRDWIHVKYVWDLNVDPDEKAALVAYVAECGWVATGADAQPETFGEIFEVRYLHSGHSTVLRLYWATFNREPDVGGALYWAEQYDSREWSTRRIASFFATSDEFATMYGPTLTDAEYVDVVYGNVLRRVPDDGGAAYWRSALREGMSRSEMLLLISNHPEFIQTHVLPSDSNPDAGPLR